MNSTLGGELDVALALVVRHERRGEGQHRAQPLAAGRDQMIGHLRDHRDFGAGPGQDHGVDPLHVGGHQGDELVDAAAAGRMFFFERNDDAHCGIPGCRPFKPGGSCLAPLHAPIHAATRMLAARETALRPKGRWPRRLMVEIVRTNDLVLIGFLQSLLQDAKIPVLVADSHISALEGMIGAFPRRLLVPEERAAAGAAADRRIGSRVRAPA